jgi:hypothetical protein
MLTVSVTVCRLLARDITAARSCDPDAVAVCTGAPASSRSPAMPASGYRGPPIMMQPPGTGIIRKLVSSDGHSAWSMGSRLMARSTGGGRGCEEVRYSA